MANSDEQSTPENPFRNDDSTNSNAGDSLGSGKHRDNSDFLSSETNFGSPGSESASPMAGSHRVSRDEFTGGDAGSSASQHAEGQGSAAQGYSAQSFSAQGDSVQHGYSQQGWQPTHAPFPKDREERQYGQGQGQDFNAGQTYGQGLQHGPQNGPSGPGQFGQSGQQTYGQNPGQGFQQGQPAPQAQQHGVARG